MRNRDHYRLAMETRAQLLEQGITSLRPDDPDARAAVLEFFMPELVQDRRDSRRNFRRQTDRLKKYFEAQGYVVDVFKRATLKDFAEVIRNKKYHSAGVDGFGNMASVATLFSDKPKDIRFGYMDWRHLATLKTHVKLGEFMMLQCCGFGPGRNFHPPLGIALMSSPQNIFGSVGVGRYATSPLPTTPVWETAVPPSYEEIRDRFQPENYQNQAPPDQLEEMGIVRRMAHKLKDTGVLSEERWEQLRVVRNRLLVPTYPPTPTPIKIPHLDAIGLLEFIEQQS